MILVTAFLRSEVLVLTVQVLGPLRVWRGADEVPLGPTGRRAVLGLLVLAEGRTISRAEMVDALWGENPPTSVINIVQSHIMHLRRLLEPTRAARTPSRHIQTVGDGYRLLVPGDTRVDLTRFRELVDEADRAENVGAFHKTAGLLGAALALWHGPVLADVPVLAQHRWILGPGLDRRRALARYIDAMVGLDNGPDVLNAAAADGAEHPLDESAQARLIRVYQSMGQRDQALTVYHRTRQRLADELGITPGSELNVALGELLKAPDGDADTADYLDRLHADSDNGHREQYKDHPSPDTDPAASTDSGDGLPVPAQLPADVRRFAGRADQLAKLDAIAATVGTVPAAVVVAAISGTAGAGKTALAVHWAHSVVKKFPSGQLYVNLRGFDPGGVAMDPANAVRGFLDALAVPAERVPASHDAQVALYRTLMADRRMLIVLDNARDSEQVRPLLPGAPGCLVLVTSRDQLTSLVVTTDAHCLPLDLLAIDEARDLLARRIGTARILAEPDAVDVLITGCARLPLALAIVAARAATRPQLPLGSIAAELYDSHTRLSALSDTDPAADVRAVFSWSYTTLTRPAARLYRLLGLHPGPDISTTAAARLIDEPVAQARQLLHELAAANLLTEHVPHRYTYHDLLRAYATDLAHRTDPEPERQAATRRTLDHYLHTAHAADRLLNPTRDPITLGPPPSSSIMDVPIDHDMVMAWFTTEHHVLLAAVDHAARAGFDTHAWQLAWTLATFLMRRGHWHDMVTVQRTAVAAASRLADPSASIYPHRLLAVAYIELGRFDGAQTHLDNALHLATQTGERAMQARIHDGFAYLYGRQHRHPEAISHSQQALALFRATDHQAGQADILHNLGSYHGMVGDHATTLAYCRQALAQFEELGDRDGQAASWYWIGHAHLHLGHLDDARATLLHALDIERNVGDRYRQAEILDRLGDTHHATGHHDAARTAWQQALHVLDDLDRKQADQIRAKLSPTTTSTTMASH